jgi:predicted DNA-binding transcriptional regulator AlpA
MKLYNQEEVAAAIGISSPTVNWWMKKKIFPQPFATYGKKDFPLWTEEQVQECKNVYRDSRRNVKGEYAESAKRTSAPEAKKEEEPKVVLDEDGLSICAECSAPVFNLQVHNDFAHKGRLSVVGRNG